MKKLLLIAPLLALGSGVALAQVHDWRDIEEVHKHIEESIHEMERAAAANHYDMDGHAARADKLLREAEHELREAIESAKRHEHRGDHEEHEKH